MRPPSSRSELITGARLAAARAFLTQIWRLRICFRRHGLLGKLPGSDKVELVMAAIGRMCEHRRNTMQTVTPSPTC